jgi:hypothetical protein
MERRREKDVTIAFTKICFGANNRDIQKLQQ